MPEKISLSASAVVASGGPKLNFSTVFNLEAYNKLHLDLADDPTATIDADLGTGGATLRMLMVVPDKPHASLTVKINGTGTARPLDRPLLLSGSGLIALVGSISSLQFKNESGQAVSIDILAGRDLTPAID